LIISHVFQEKIELANLIRQSNFEINKVKAIADRRLEALEKARVVNKSYIEKYGNLETELTKVLSNSRYNTSEFNNISKILKETTQYITSFKEFTFDEPVRILGDLELSSSNESSARLESHLRERERENQLLREQIEKIIR
jgi:hypothetical protein